MTFKNRSNEFIEDLIAKLSHARVARALLLAFCGRWATEPKSREEGPRARGADIFASPDGLGLEELARIFVEVKHRQSTSMGAPQIRSFMGGRQPGDRCLYVSTGGFTKEAKYEADRSANPAQALGAYRSFEELVVEYYRDKLDDPTRALVPLRRLYWPAALTLFKGLDAIPTAQTSSRLFERFAATVVAWGDWARSSVIIYH